MTASAAMPVAIASPAETSAFSTWYAPTRGNRNVRFRRHVDGEALPEAIAHNPREPDRDAPRPTRISRGRGAAVNDGLRMGVIGGDDGWPRCSRSLNKRSFAAR